MASEAVPRLMPHDLAAEDPVQQTAPRMPTQETASFNPYLAAYGFTKDFCRVSDVVFAYQHPYRRVVLGYEDLPWHSEPGSSMYLEEGHYAVRERARDRVAAL